ncbi:nuclear receptor-binding protein [Anopheles darlingi]|uniref:Nuclear receptor-binding protein homolog n=1 Tax=Anopheles darlingi TaxID=43151 RepID=W5JSU5_ANODA|nr:nuclear receptor-binding protein [Anopheles darlingi]
MSTSSMVRSAKRALGLLGWIVRPGSKPNETLRPIMPIGDSISERRLQFGSLGVDLLDNALLDLFFGSTSGCNAGCALTGLNDGQGDTLRQSPPPVTNGPSTSSSGPPKSAKEDSEIQWTSHEDSFCFFFLELLSTTRNSTTFPNVPFPVDSQAIRRRLVPVATPQMRRQHVRRDGTTLSRRCNVDAPQVEQRDVPGIDCAHLAMDTEEGVEVVWNEVQFSERKNFKSQEEKIQLVFENLTQLEHPNIVKFHRYWTDTHNDKPRVIFITEYMSSGSLKQFLKRTKKNVKKLPLQAWKRWCTQILSALSYLHSCSPPVIHGNLTCDTIFIQHNGLVKIGSVAPDAIHHHVKTCRDNMKNMHFIAPEYGSAASTTAIDVYSFGICALEMAALEIQGNGDSGTLVTDEHIKRTVESLEDAQQKDFINKCLSHDPAKRPSARELLFHPLLFEVHALKLLAAHCLVNTSSNYDEMLQKLYKPEVVYAEIRKVSETFEYHLGDIVGTEKLEKFVEDVKYGIYPLTAFSAQKPPATRPRAISPETAESVKSATPEPLDIETRKVVNMICSVKPREENCELFMTILLRMDDKMNRQLTCPISADDSAVTLSHELVHLGFIHEIDREKIATMIEDTLRNHQQKMHGTSKIPSATALTSAGSVTGDLGVAIGSMSDPLTAASSSASSLSAKANHLHHHVPVHSAS